MSTVRQYGEGLNLKDVSCTSKVTQTEKCLEELNTVVNLCLEHSSILYDRLEKVRASPPLMKEASPDKQPVKNLVPLAAAIDGNTQLLRDVASTLAAILDQLEI